MPKTPLASPPHQDLGKALRQRHVTMISLGGIIGAGLFVGSSATISVMGPGAFLSYLLAINLMSVESYGEFEYWFALAALGGARQ